MKSTPQPRKSKGFKNLACALRDAIVDSECITKKKTVDLNKLNYRIFCSKLEGYGFGYIGESVPDQSLEEALKSLLLYSKKEGLIKKLLGAGLMLNPSLCGHFVEVLEHKGWEYQKA